MNWQDIRRAWNEFWYKPASPLPIAIFRILLGLLVLYFCALIGPDLTTLFGFQGIYSNQTPGVLVAWSDFSLQFIFVVLIIAAICMTLGLCSTLSAVVVFLGLRAFDYQNPYILHGGYMFLRLMVFYMIFARSGAAISLDHLIQLRSGKTPLLEVPSWPLRLMQITLALGYWSAFSWKLSGAMWIDGTAVYYATHLYEIHRWNIPYLFDNFWSIKLLTWATLAIEFSLCTLIWIKEFRYPVLLLGLLMHLGLELEFSTTILQWVMIASYVTFLDPATIQKALSLVGLKVGQVSTKSSSI